jgi:hypothetical protein
VAWPKQSLAFLGTEMGPLLQLVAGQVQEIEQLTAAVSVAQQNQDTVLELNRGIDQAVNQLQSLQAIVERAQELDPSSVRSISDLNDLIRRVKSTKSQLNEVIQI